MGKKKNKSKWQAYRPADNSNTSQRNLRQGSSWGEGHRLGGVATDQVRVDASHSGTCNQRNVPAGLRRVQERGDGNCFFHAIARQVFDDADYAGRTRTEICDWMQAHLLPSAVAAGRSPLSAEHQELIVSQRGEVFSLGRRDGDSTLLRYVRNMRCHGQWGSGLEALCVAYCYGCLVHVWSPGGMSVLEPPKERLQPGRTPVRLMHNGRNHWDSLFVLPGHSSDDITNSDIDDSEDAELAAALNASILDFSLSFGAASSNSSWIATSLGDNECFVDSSMSPAATSNEQRSQRELAASAALKRQSCEDTRGLGHEQIGKELKQSHEKLALLGKLAERCARRGEDVPIGAGLASTAKLRAAVEARAPDISIDGLELGRFQEQHVSNSVCSPNQDGPFIISEAKTQQEGASKNPSGRWGRRQRLVTETHAVSPTSVGSGSASVSIEASPPATLDTTEPTGSIQTALHEPTRQASGAPLLRLHLVEESDELQGLSGSVLEECVAALLRLGFCPEEAANIVECCDCDVERVKTLYGIDWDGERTTQVPFIGPS